MFLRIETSVSTMLAQQNLATMRALNAAFGNAQAPAPAPAPAQPTRTAIANKTSAITSVTLRQQVAEAADVAANAANATGAGQTESPPDQQPQTGGTSAALSVAHAAYAEVSNP
jgi:hypothetical protein